MGDYCFFGKYIIAYSYYQLCKKAIDPIGERVV